MISSTGNGKIRELIKLKKNAKERSGKGVFLVEGPKMFWEIPRNFCLEVYVSESFLRTEEGMAAKKMALENGIRTETVADPVFQYLSDTKSPQGILAVVKQMRYGLEDLTKAAQTKAAQASKPSISDESKKKAAAPLIVILENLQDPGNLGTILRTAEAAGASGILLSKGCADIYNPKVTRSTMGSIFRVPFVYAEDLAAAVGNLKVKGVRVLAAHLRGSVELYEESYTGPTAIMIGNESRGLTDEMAALADQAVRIPMSGNVESLNAAVAAAVFLFEAKRKRCEA